MSLPMDGERGQCKLLYNPHMHAYVPILSQIWIHRPAGRPGRSLISSIASTLLSYLYYNYTLSPENRNLGSFCSSTASSLGKSGLDYALSSRSCSQFRLRALLWISGLLKGNDFHRTCGAGPSTPCSCWSRG